MHFHIILLTYTCQNFEQLLFEIKQHGSTPFQPFGVFNLSSMNQKQIKLYWINKSFKEFLA